MGCSKNLVKAGGPCINKLFIVFGAGPSLKKHINYVKENYDLNEYLLVSADGATTAMLEEDLVPDIVATDLDGKMSDLLTANSLGSYFVIHAHGDNMDKIAKLTPFFTSVLGTTQAQPVGNVYNFGGFTDGDRAIFLSVALKNSTHKNCFPLKSKGTV